ncbi:hypothetical protein GALMADRAFT_1280339 [Galerina marginata CBS 339.88]|uniref:Uncharacterized protein n=1 Tax=Galerina marginata (strain CBS 339.88) TaxID=685588 RepID=A0A067T6X8_GALM3|nr:hypothetical protein GALMADRAFT_1280339 [Galerina marginata CBS 339.88]
MNLTARYLRNSLAIAPSSLLKPTGSQSSGTTTSFSSQMALRTSAAPATPHKPNCAPAIATRTLHSNPGSSLLGSPRDNHPCPIASPSRLGLNSPKFSTKATISWKANLAQPQTPTKTSSRTPWNLREARGRAAAILEEMEDAKDDQYSSMSITAVNSPPSIPNNQQDAVDIMKSSSDISDDLPITPLYRASSAFAVQDPLPSEVRHSVSESRPLVDCKTDRGVAGGTGVDAGVPYNEGIQVSSTVVQHLPVILDARDLEGATILFSMTSDVKLATTPSSESTLTNMGSDSLSSANNKSGRQLAGTRRFAKATRLGKVPNVVPPRPSNDEIHEDDFDDWLAKELMLDEQLGPSNALQMVAPAITYHSGFSQLCTPPSESHLSHLPAEAAQESVCPPPDIEPPLWVEDLKAVKQGSETSVHPASLPSLTPSSRPDCQRKAIPSPVFAMDIEPVVIAQLNVRETPSAKDVSFPARRPQVRQIMINPCKIKSDEARRHANEEEAEADRLIKEMRLRKKGKPPRHMGSAQQSGGCLNAPANSGDAPAKNSNVPVHKSTPGIANAIISSPSLVLSQPEPKSTLKPRRGNTTTQGMDLKVIKNVIRTRSPSEPPILPRPALLDRHTDDLMADSPGSFNPLIERSVTTTAKMLVDSKANPPNSVTGMGNTLLEDDSPQATIVNPTSDEFSKGHTTPNNHPQHVISNLVPSNPPRTTGFVNGVPDSIHQSNNNLSNFHHPGSPQIRVATLIPINDVQYQSARAIALTEHVQDGRPIPSSSGTDISLDKTSPDESTQPTRTNILLDAVIKETSEPATLATSSPSSECHPTFPDLPDDDDDDEWDMVPIPVIGFNAPQVPRLSDAAPSTSSASLKSPFMVPYGQSFQASFNKRDPAFNGNIVYTPTLPRYGGRPRTDFRSPIVTPINLPSSLDQNISQFRPSIENAMDVDEDEDAMAVDEVDLDIEMSDATLLTCFPWPMDVDNHWNETAPMPSSIEPSVFPNNTPVGGIFPTKPAPNSHPEPERGSKPSSVCIVVETVLPSDVGGIGSPNEPLKKDTRPEGEHGTRPPPTTHSEEDRKECVAPKPRTPRGKSRSAWSRLHTVRRIQKGGSSKETEPDADPETRQKNKKPASRSDAANISKMPKESEPTNLIPALLSLPPDPWFFNMPLAKNNSNVPEEERKPGADRKPKKGAFTDKTNTPKLSETLPAKKSLKVGTPSQPMSAQVAHETTCSPIYRDPLIYGWTSQKTTVTFTAGVIEEVALPQESQGLSSSSPALDETTSLQYTATDGEPEFRIPGAYPWPVPSSKPVHLKALLLDLLQTGLKAALRHKQR